MTLWVLTRGFLRDYARNSTNLVVLVLVPIVFVLVAADSLADAARLLGGDGAALEQATAGWAAARMLTGSALALAVTAVALVVLAVREPPADPSGCWWAPRCSRWSTSASERRRATSSGTRSTAP